MAKLLSILLVLVSVLVVASCKPNKKNNADTISNDSASVTVNEKEELKKSDKVSYRKSFTAPNKIQFNITTLGDDSLRALQIIAVKDGIFLTDINEDIIGELIIVRITDLNANDSPELMLFTETRDKTEKWHLYAYEFSDDNWTKVYFPKLTDEQLKGYKGDDVYRLMDKNMLKRTFPIHSIKDSIETADSSRVIEYKLNAKAEMYVDTVRVE